MGLIDEVKERTDLVQIVAEFADLETSSRNPRARCPFHTERTPSFFVFPETGTWRCFGACSTGGDVITFVMKRDNISFKEALRLLAERAGIEYGREDRPSADRTSRTTVLQANDVAARWFAQMLLSSAGAHAREYLEKRGISTETAERRGIGYSPGDGLITLSGQLRSASVESRAARDAKLVVQSKDGEWRDFFRNRLMMEIRDRQGNVIGFGARTLDGGEPKYLNTPQTEAFDKSKVLYGLNWAAESIRQSRRAVVVEGYMDAITAHEHGFTNVVAAMGTAVTPEQLGSLSRLVSGGDEAGEIILCMDADAAGREATLRALETAWRQFGTGGRSQRDNASTVKVASAVEGKDPDEAIRADAWAWRSSLDSAMPVIDFIMDAYAQKYDLNTGVGKARVVETVAPLIFAVTNNFDQDEYWTRLAKMAGVTTERLRSMVQPAAAGVRRGSRRPARGARGDNRIATEQLGSVLDNAQEGLEEYLLALIIQREDLREFAAAVPSEHFLNSANREIFTLWQESTTLDSLPESAEAELGERIARFQARAFPPSDQVRRVNEVNQCVRRLRERHLRHVLQLAEKALQEQEPLLEGEEREELRNRTIGPSLRLKQLFTGRV